MGKTSQISLPGPNHDVKNARYQLVGGSGGAPAVIVNHRFDAMMLKIAGITSEVAHIDEYASDALVLGLTSPMAVKMLVCVLFGFIFLFY